MLDQSFFVTDFVLDDNLNAHFWIPKSLLQSLFSKLKREKDFREIEWEGYQAPRTSPEEIANQPGRPAFSKMPFPVLNQSSIGFSTTGINRRRYQKVETVFLNQKAQIHLVDFFCAQPNEGFPGKWKNSPFTTIGKQWARWEGHRWGE